MRVNVYSRRGHFNLLNFNEESISTSIRIEDSDNPNTPKPVSITTEYEVNENGPEETSKLIDGYLKSVWYTSDRDRLKEMSEFLKANSLQLEKGNTVHELGQLKKKMANLELEIERKESTLKLLEEEIKEQEGKVIR